MHRLITVLLLLVFCATIKAEKFEKIGTINIRGFSELTPKLTQLLQNVDARKKSFPVIAAAAITFNPQMRGFDFNSRIKIFYYIPKDRECEAPDWCILINRVSGYALPEQVTIMGQPAYTKTVDTRALISNNSDLLDTIDDAPVIADTAADIEIQFQTGILAKKVKGGPDRLLNWTKDLLTNGEVTPAETGLVTRHNLGLKELLAQVSTMTISVSILNDRVLINTELAPEKNSCFAEFVKKQAANSNNLPGLVSAKNISATFNITPFEPAREAMTRFLADIETGMTKPEQKDYLRLMQSIVENSNGKVTYFLEENDQNQITAFARFYCNGEKNADSVDQTFKSISRYSQATNGLHQIYSTRQDTYRLFGTVQDKNIDFVAGTLDANSAAKLLDGIPAKIPDLDQYGMFYANVNFNSRQYLTAELSCSKSVTFRLTLFAAMLKKFVPENIEKPE